MNEDEFSYAIDIITSAIHKIELLQSAISLRIYQQERNDREERQKT